MMRKAPNPKHQAPGKLQIPGTKQQADRALEADGGTPSVAFDYQFAPDFCLRFGAWIFPGAWSLELGIFWARILAVVCLQTLGMLFLTDLACAQARPGTDFRLTKITKNFVSTPQFTYSGAEQYQANQRDRWLEVEVEFAAAPDFTDELTFKYFILLNGRLLTGEVTHVNVAAGRENRSVMYVSPRTLARFMGNRALTPNAVQNIAVQILQQGAIKDEMSSTRTAGQWYAGLPAVNGFVLNKNETPFAPLYWDRYEEIKPR
jgi:hypothetical protein